MKAESRVPEVTWPMLPSKRFNNKTCSQHNVAPPRTRTSVCPQDGMEKGQSGRKQRRKSPELQGLASALSSKALSLPTPDCPLDATRSAGTSPLPGSDRWVTAAPRVLFGLNCKTNPEEETNGKSSFNSANPRQPSSVLELGNTSMSSLSHIK